MKRLGTLLMAIILITGCNAMKPNMEEIELLWSETEKRIETWALPTKTESSPTRTSQAIREPKDEIPREMPKSAEKSSPQPPTATPTPEPLLPEQESPRQPKQTADQQAENPKLIEWPYITCPPAPTSTPAQEWPYITAPEPPAYTPEPTEPPQDEPTPTPAPVAPVVPADPAPKPTEQPADPTLEQPSSGYAECSCGARLAPEEVLPHMKAHAMNGESHSYRAY